MLKKEREILRLLDNYTRTKLNRLEKCLDMLIQFARDDLKRIDEVIKKNPEVEDEK